MFKENYDSNFWFLSLKTIIQLRFFEKIKFFLKEKMCERETLFFLVRCC